jgi:hypothetical protein
MNNKVPKIIFAGLLGGFIGEGIMGGIFMSAPIQKVLYDPALQSDLFLEITPTRDLVTSVAGLVVLSVIHSWLFYVFHASIPGKTWYEKGLFWGLTIWLMYWLFQEWFIYHTLLREPIFLNLIELCILMLGSLAEGCIISLILHKDLKSIKKNSNV